jgi:hypothetical protein
LLILWPCRGTKDMLWFMLLKNKHFSFLCNFKQILMTGDWIVNDHLKVRQTDILKRPQSFKLILRNY